MGLNKAVRTVHHEVHIHDSCSINSTLARLVWANVIICTIVGKVLVRASYVRGSNLLRNHFVRISWVYVHILCIISSFAVSNDKTSKTITDWSKSNVFHVSAVGVMSEIPCGRVGIIGMTSRVPVVRVDIVGSKLLQQLCTPSAQWYP